MIQLHRTIHGKRWFTRRNRNGRFSVHLLLWVLLLASIGTLQAQDLGNLSHQKPVVFHGSIGTSANFYSSNEPVNTQPPYAWSLYGSFTPQLYGWALPFSFLINQYSRSYTSPFTQFGVSPTYKWMKLHLGYRTLQLSPLTFDGQSFRGAGIELTPGLFRFSAFYGRLNRAVNEDTTSGRYAMPQYARTAYGVKIGIGSRNNYWDFIYFHAKDDSASTRIINKNNTPRPQENAVLGTAFKLSLARRISWTGELAFSGLTQDQAFQAVAVDSANKNLPKFLHSFLPYNASTVGAWAGQTSLGFLLRNFNLTLGYKRVQPDFKSLGTPYTLNDIEVYSLSNGWMLAKGRLNINTNLASQQNDLNKKLASQLHTLTGNMNINALLCTHFNLNLNLSGYDLHQTDGTMKIDTAVRVDQQIWQLSLTPSYTFQTAGNAHTITGNCLISTLHDNNKVTAPANGSENLSASLTYGLYLTALATNFSLNGLYSRYKQGNDTYSSTGANLGAGTQLLKNRSLSLQGTMGYLFNQFSAGNAKGNITFSFNAAWHSVHHALSAWSNYVITPVDKISSIINKIPYAVTTNNLAGGIAYTYSF